MSVAEIALPCAATRCFPDLVSRDSNGLVLISFRPRARVCATPEDSLGVNAYLDDSRSRQTCNCHIRSIITRTSAPVSGCVFAIEELLSPDLDQIKQGEQVA